MSDRDATVDPRVGDSVLAAGPRGRQRTVYCLFARNRIGWATESPIASGIITLAEWRKWAHNGEVITRGNEKSEGAR